VAHVLTVESSQVEYVRAFGEWLKAYQRDLPRPAFVDVLAGKRRGGKTWVMVALILLAAVAVPYRLHKDGHRVNFIGWLVVPSYPEQRELHEDIMAVLARRRDIASREMLQVLGAIPEKWWTFRPHPTNGYMFVHGSQVYLKSANRPDSLKQGRVDVVGLNEGQKVDSEAPVHCAGNTIDGGGLLIMAANAPRRARGQWLKEVKYKDTTPGVQKNQVITLRPVPPQPQFQPQVQPVRPPMQQPVAPRTTYQAPRPGNTGFLDGVSTWFGNNVSGGPAPKPTYVEK
jgi:hypothetical protein